MTFCELFIQLHQKYFYLAISGIGIILNLLSSFAFIVSKDLAKYKGNVFKYLLFKSICDSFIASINFFFSFIDQNFSSFFEKVDFLCNLRQIFYFYLFYTLTSVSILCDVGSSFNRYRCISNKFSFLNRIPFLVKIGLMVGYSAVFYIYYFFNRECVYFKIANSTQFIKKFNYSTTFDTSILGQIIYFWNSFIRDGICVFLIILFNILILILVRETNKRKQRLTNNKQNSSRKKSEQAQINLTILVLITSLLNVIGHAPKFLLNLPFFKSLRSNTCFFNLQTFLFISLHSFSFVVYYAFNNHFRHFYKAIILKSIQFFSFNLLKFSITFNQNDLTTKYIVPKTNLVNN
jgi:hypothetical protein